MLMATHAFKPTRARDRVLGLALTSPLLGADGVGGGRRAVEKPGWGPITDEMVESAVEIRESRGIR